MKNPIRSILLLSALAFVATCVPAHAADDVPAVVNATVETAAAVAQPFIVQFAQSHPWLLTALALMATARLVFKPVVTAVEAYVRSTPQRTDDEFVERVTHSRTFKIFAWLLDYLGSIKVGPQFKAEPKSETPAQP